MTEESIIDNPVLKKKFEDYDAEIFEKELEDLRESLTEIMHLQCDNQLITEICNGCLQDSQINGTTLPAGVTLDPNTGLYWITDKNCVPNISILKDRIIIEFHNTAGHPDAKRTNAVIPRSFYWHNLKRT